MSLECPSCATDIEPANGLCPICGYEFADKRRWGIKLIAVILALLLIYPLFKLLQFCLGY